MSPLPQSTLLGPRLRLRPFIAQDTDALFEVGSDPEVMRYISKPVWTRREDAAEAIGKFLASREQGTGVVWAITEAGEDRVIGYVTVFNHDGAQRRATIGYALARRVHGRRVGSEAVPLVVGFCFRELGLRRLEAEVDPENTASRKLLTRTGFLEEGFARERWEFNGTLSDSVCYGMLAREFPVVTAD